MAELFRKREKKDLIDPAAFSRDGYLINQGLLKEISYGRRTTRETGCGWIACYNFLRYMGKQEPPLEVARRMEKMLLWGGLIGSHPLAVWWYLHRRGFRFRAAFTCRGMERAVERCVGRRAGVVAYWHGKGAHFVTFVEGGVQEAAQGTGREETEKVPADDERAKPQEKPCRKGSPKLRFLNASYGAQNQQLTAREFYKTYVRFPLMMVIVAR